MSKLCRIGLHRWKYVTVVDKDVDEDGTTYLTVTTYGWCVRVGCHEWRARIIDVERRVFVRRSWEERG